MVASVARDTVGSVTNVIMTSENAGETGIDKEDFVLYPIKEVISARLCADMVGGVRVRVGLANKVIHCWDHRGDSIASGYGLAQPKPQTLTTYTLALTLTLTSEP